MRKVKLVITSLISLLLISYVIYVEHEFSKGIDYQVIAAVTKDSYPLIPNKLAMLYLKHGPNPNDNKNEFGQLPLSIAIAGIGMFDNDKNVFKVTKILLERGADINEYNNGLTPFHEAILFGDVELTKMLIAAGADPKLKITRDNKANDLNACQFAKLLAEKDSERYSSMVNLLVTTTNKSLNKDACCARAC